MRRRSMLALGVLAAVAAVALLALRANGLLGGVDGDGPLHGRNAGGVSGMSVARGSIVTYNGLELANTGDRAAMVESVDVVRSGPLEIVDVVIQPFDAHQIGYDGRPRGPTLPVEGARIPPATSWFLALAIRSRTRGELELRTVRVRYRRGARRFEEVVDVGAVVRVRG